MAKQNGSGNGRGRASSDTTITRGAATNGDRASSETARGNTANSTDATEASHHHRGAAFHHDTAAHHHRQAANHYDAGNHTEADFHARAAAKHEEDANELAKAAQRASGARISDESGDSEFAQSRTARVLPTDGPSLGTGNGGRGAKNARHVKALSES